MLGVHPILKFYGDNLFQMKISSSSLKKELRIILNTSSDLQLNLAQANN